MGKSHLLQASYLAAFEKKISAVYLSLSEAKLKPEVLEGLDEMSLVCLDDLHCVLGDSAWEEALFHFYNRLSARKSRLFVAASSSPRHLACTLLDLKSRLSSGTIYQVQGLNDSQKLSAIQLHAKQRGLHLATDVADFLLKRCARDMKSLFQILEELDKASLRDKRALTIPFVKSVMSL